MPIRLKDIAKDLNLSAVTISKVVRNQSDISPETKKRVLERMRELNYQPNFAARTLVTGRTYSIGFVVPSLLHSFFAEIAKGIVDVIRPLGYGLLISSADEDPELERQEVDQQMARQADALIVASSQLSGTFYRDIQSRGVPLIMVDRRFSDLRTNFIGARDEDIGFAATEHLIERGCKVIAHLRGPDVSTGLGRFHGYLKALKRYGLRPAPELVVQVSKGDTDAEESGCSAMREILKRGLPFDGLFCYNDPVAVGAMETALNAGLRIPDDLAVVGCGNARWARALRIPLSSVDQGSTEIGTRAAKLALKLINSRNVAKQKTILLPASVVARASTQINRAMDVSTSRAQ